MTMPGCAGWAGHGGRVSVGGDDAARGVDLRLCRSNVGCVWGCVPVERVKRGRGAACAGVTMPGCVREGVRVRGVTMPGRGAPRRGAAWAGRVDSVSCSRASP